MVHVAVPRVSERYDFELGDGLEGCPWRAVLDDQLSLGLARVSRCVRQTYKVQGGNEKHVGFRAGVGGGIQACWVVFARLFLG